MPPKRKVSAATVAEAINKLLTRDGRPPTIEELRNELGVGSTRTVLRYLEELDETGVIERWPGARGMRMARQPDAAAAFVDVPIVGEAPAGPLLAAEENLQGWVRIGRSRMPAGRLFLLRVRGDSMNRAAVHDRKIEDGDLVLVRQTPSAETGDIIVALIDGQATIKRLKRGPHYLVLRPDSNNPAHNPFVVDHLDVQGVVIDVIKDGEAAIWGE